MPRVCLYLFAKMTVFLTQKTIGGNVALSITRGQSKWAYMIKPDDPCAIWFRLNQHRKNWKVYERFDSAQTATDALLRLTSADDARASGLGAEVQP